MKKGFTLVELMGVIVVLCILILMSVPAINNTLKKQEEKEYNQFLESVCLGTKAYMRHNADKYETFFENKGTTTVCIKDVYDGGYLSKELANPDTNRVERTAKITVHYNADGTFKCDYSLDASKCIDLTPISNSNIISNINSNSNAIIDDPSNANG